MSLETVLEEKKRACTAGNSFVPTSGAGAEVHSQERKMEEDRGGMKKVLSHVTERWEGHFWKEETPLRCTSISFSSLVSATQRNTA